MSDEPRKYYTTPAPHMHQDCPKKSRVVDELLSRTVGIDLADPGADRTVRVTFEGQGKLRGITGLAVIDPV